MRIAVATVLLMAAAVGWAAEPAAPDANKEPAAASEKERQFKPPGGWRPKRVNGELIYCTKVREYNSRISREECRTEAQLRDQQRADRASREDIEKASRACSGTGCQN
jgi:hypothetical protein